MRGRGGVETIIVPSAQGEYPVMIGEGLLDKLGEIAAGAWPGKRAMIVTDSNVAALYLNACHASLSKEGFQVASAVIAPGEGSKNIQTLVDLYHAFQGAGLSRTDGVIALGGGVVGDLAGFAAATYLRGLALIQAPTTLLAQVDAAIGGKTGLDLPFGKNMVGAFYAPRAVVADLNTLQTLEPRRLAEGMAEVIKYGCILDEKLFVSLENGTPPLGELVGRCARLKAELVSQDERDLGERNLLNFGHTLGHALEQATGFIRYTHGEAVAAGMAAALKIGEKLGITVPDARSRLIPILGKWGLPTEITVPLERLLPALGCDKKRRGARIQFVLLRRIGQSLLHLLTIAELEHVLREVWGDG
ncbi:MAG TPA: 3-dehydroquinate synthase [Firmicutes bacterium]|nr:3-dehydroquinate synthase [Bacillota bacterium]